MLAKIEEFGVACTSKARTVPRRERGRCSEGQIPGKRIEPKRPFLDTLRQHLEESFKKDITPEYCTKVYEHVQKIEERYWNTDLMIDDEIEIEDDEFNQF